MTDLRGRHGRNFDGRFIRISGDDGKLNDVLDELEYVSCCKVLSRCDLEQARTGMLTIQAKAAVSPRIAEIARKYGLIVEGACPAMGG